MAREIPKEGDLYVNFHPEEYVSTLGTNNLSIGDLVTVNSDKFSTIYRIIKDVPPARDITMTQMQNTWNSSTCLIWAKPKKPRQRKQFRCFSAELRGKIILKPAFSFGEKNVSKSSRSVIYRNVHLIKKVDVLFLSQMFAKFNAFILEEAKRMST